MTTMLLATLFMFQDGAPIARDLADAYARRVDAESNKLRAVGEFHRSMAEAQRTLAERLRILAETDLVLEAVEKERIRNRIDRIASYHKIRRMEFENRELRKDDALESARKELERKTVGLTELPAGANGATNLNALLEILFLHPPEKIRETTPVPLPPAVISSLVVWDGFGSRKARRPLANAEDYQLEPPRLFRSSLRLAEALPSYLEVRGRMIADVTRGSRPSDAAFDEAMALLESLGDLVAAQKPKHKRERYQDPEHLDYEDANRFLAEQSRQIGMFAVAKRPPPPFQGSSLQELVLFMRLNGMRIAPAGPEATPAYNALGLMLRDLLRMLPRPNAAKVADNAPKTEPGAGSPAPSGPPTIKPLPSGIPPPGKPPVIDT